MHDLGKKKWEKHLDFFLAKNLEILVEQKKDKKTGLLTGLANNYIRVNLEGQNFLMNQLVNVKIERREGKILLGTLIN